MSNSLNVVWLAGTVGKDAELRQTKNGKNFVNFPLATNREWAGNQLTDWHSVTIFGKAAKDLRKGTQVFVKGEYVTDSWVDKNSGQKKYKQSVTGFSLSVDPTEDYIPAPQSQPQQNQSQPFTEDDISF